MTGSFLNVNKLLKHGSLLASLGIKYTLNNPYAKCPFCSKPQLARFRLSNTSDDTTYYCYNCFYSGDLFDIYRAKNYINNVDTTFADLIASGSLLIGKDAITASDISKYDKQHVKVITAIDEYWYACKQNLYHSSIMIGKQLLQTYGMWQGAMTEFAYYRSALRFIGISSNEHTISSFPEVHLSTGLKKGWKGFIAYPYEVVPGVITNFVIQNDKNIKKLTEDDELVPAHLSAQGDGFFMLSSVHPDESTVYAFSDPAMAVQAQQCHYSRGAAYAAPIVAWGADTTLDNWYNLPGKKVVLYSPEPDLELFRQAIFCGFRAYITNAPNVTSAKFFHSEYNNRGITFHKKMGASAVHWPEAFVAWAMTATIESGLDMVANLPIGFHEKGLIMSACKEQSQKERMDKLFGSEMVQSKFIDVGVGRIYEEHNEWWSISEKSTREMVCSNPIYFEELIVDPDGHLPPMVSGYIKNKEASIKFTIELLKFEKSPLASYKELVLAQAKTVPIISSALGKKLLETIYAFQRPTSTLQPSTIGYSTDTHEFRLANVLISGNGCRSIPCTLDNLPTFGLGVYPTSLPLAVGASITAQGTRSEVFLAILGLFLSNTMCYAMGREPTPIGIVGEPWKNPLGWRAVLDITDAFKMPVHVIANKAVSTVKALVAEHIHKLPLVMDISGCSLKEAKEILLTVRDKNVIVPVTPLQANILGINNDWTIVEAKTISNYDKRTAQISCVISFLEHYLRIGSPNYPDEHLSQPILKEMKRWLLPYAMDLDSFNKLFAKALVIARGNRLLREDKTKALLLDIYSIAAEIKQVSITPWVDNFSKTGEVDCGKNIVLVDIAADVVLINVKNLAETCLAYGGLDIKLSAMTEVFSNDAVLVTDKLEKEVYSIPGWVIKGSAWNSAVDSFTTDVAIKLFSS